MRNRIENLDERVWSESFGLAARTSARITRRVLHQIRHIDKDSAGYRQSRPEASGMENIDHQAADRVQEE